MSEEKNSQVAGNQQKTVDPKSREAIFNLIFSRISGYIAASGVVSIGFSWLDQKKSDFFPCSNIIFGGLCVIVGVLLFALIAIDINLKILKNVESKLSCSARFSRCMISCVTIIPFSISNNIIFFGSFMLFWPYIKQGLHL